MPYPHAPDPGRRPLVTRRRLLQGGAALTAGGALFTTGLLRSATSSATGLAPAASPAPAPGPVSCVDVHTFDAMAGICAFVVPGDDPYSRHQRVSTAQPGAVAAGAPQALALSLNQVLDDPFTVAQLQTSIEERYGRPPPEAQGQVCSPVGTHIVQPGGVGLAAVIGILVDLIALDVRPDTAEGPFRSSFARLTWDEKAEAWRRFEEEVAPAFTPPDWMHETPVLDVLAGVLETLAGLLAYASGAVLELVGLLTYCEGLAYDRSAGALVGTPVGWHLSGYQVDTGVVDGWDELRGYYQGRTAIDA